MDQRTSKPSNDAELSDLSEYGIDIEDYKVCAEFSIKDESFMDFLKEIVEFVQLHVADQIENNIVLDELVVCAFVPKADDGFHFYGPFYEKTKVRLKPVNVKLNTKTDMKTVVFTARQFLPFIESVAVNARNFAIVMDSKGASLFQIQVNQ